MKCKATNVTADVFVRSRLGDCGVLSDTWLMCLVGSFGLRVKLCYALSVVLDLVSCPKCFV